MVAQIVSVEVVGGYRLLLRFADGKEGVVDLAGVLSFRGVFASLEDHGYFERVRVDAESGTIVWPNGADLDPDMLYSIATNQPLPHYSQPGTKLARA